MTDTPEPSEARAECPSCERPKDQRWPPGIGTPCNDAFHEPASAPPQEREAARVDLAERLEEWAKQIAWPDPVYTDDMARDLRDAAQLLTQQAKERALAERLRRRASLVNNDGMHLTAALMYEAARALSTHSEGEAARVEYIGQLEKALEAEWLRNHDECCDNLHGCESFGGERTCYCPRPRVLSEGSEG